MTIQDIHYEIWQDVVNALTKGLLQPSDVHDIKRDTVQRLYDKGKINATACNYLHMHSNCVLCTVYGSCPSCPLKNCSYGSYYSNMEHALYKHLRGDALYFALCIRDVAFTSEEFMIKKRVDILEGREA